MDYIKKTNIYKEEGQYSLKLDVYLPEKAVKKMPVVIYLHGGALVMGSRSMVNKRELAAVLGNQMAYISADYRLAPESKLMKIKEDIEDLISWVREEGRDLYGFDPDRVVMLGKSAGGYLSLLSGTFQNKPDAIISFYGYGDILGDWYEKPSPHYLSHPLVTEEEAKKCLKSKIMTGSGFKSRWALYLYTRQAGSWAVTVSGCEKSETKTALIPYCPIHNIGPEYPPTFLLHGSADTDVPVEQSSEMYDALIKEGIKAKLLIIPQAGHGFDYGWRKAEQFAEIIDYMNKVLL